MNEVLQRGQVPDKVEKMLPDLTEEVARLLAPFGWATAAEVNGEFGHVEITCRLKHETERDGVKLQNHLKCLASVSFAEMLQRRDVGRLPLEISHKILTQALQTIRRGS